MKISTASKGTDSLLARAATGAAADPTPPARWSRWWTSPIATVDYGLTARMPLWQEARIPAERSVTGQLHPALVYGGATRDDAIKAAHLLAAAIVSVSFSYANGRVGTTDVNPAYAVLRDTKAGAFWLAPLTTTIKLQGEWVEAPHTIDGAAFEGPAPMLPQSTVLTATRDMVAVVGRDTVLKPHAWTSAPDDSQIDKA